MAGVGAAMSDGFTLAWKNAPSSVKGAAPRHDDDNAATDAPRRGELATCGVRHGAYAGRRRPSPLTT